METILEIKNLRAGIEGKEILKGVDLNIEKGKIHAIMGPNGSGKSTLSLVLMGHPKYEVKKGSVLFEGKNVLEMNTTERAKSGIFLGFQYPSEVQGIKMTTFLRNSSNALNGKGTVSILKFKESLKKKMEKLKIDEKMASRSLNEGFSGGEKKRSEILQMSVLQPKLAVLDEPDSGLDIDALKLVAEQINEAAKQGTSVVLITHYERILQYVKPDYVHVFMGGKVMLSGGKELAQELEKKGYELLLNDACRECRDVK